MIRIIMIPEEVKHLKTYAFLTMKFRGKEKPIS